MLPTLQTLHHMLLCQYSIIGYFTALFCVLMASIDVIMLGEWRLGSITCNIWYTVDTVLNTTSAWLSTSLMLERLMSTEVSQLYLNLSKKCKTLVAFFPWVLSILLTSLGISLQKGGFYNFVSNNATSIEQCYIVDQSNETAIYSVVVSFLLPYVITLSLFITIKSKAAFKQTRLTLSKSLDSISDVLLDSALEESPNNPPYFSEHNYTPAVEDTLGKVDILTDTRQRNRESEDVYDKASPNGHSLFQAKKVYGKREASDPGHVMCRKHCYNRSICTCSPSLPNKVSERPRRVNGSSQVSASQHQLVRTKTVLNDKYILRKGHLNAKRKSKPLNAFANPYKKTMAKPCGKSTPSAYLAALHKAKQKRRVNKSYEKMSNDTQPTTSEMMSDSSCAKHTSNERIEQVYVNRKCIPTTPDQSEPRLQHSVNKFCSLHGNQCQSVTRYADNGDASSSDSESSHGLIQKDDKTEVKPKREHIIMTNILQSEQLKTVHHLALMVSMYALLWMPFYILRLLLRFAPEITIYHYIYTTIHLIGYFSSGICPWFYYVLHGYINSSTWPNMKYRILNPSSSDLSSASSI